jgi:polysaccharide pyruvyl transferase WcaK-like protein
VPTIGVSVRFWNEDRSELEALVRALHEIRRQRQVNVRLLPFHEPSDSEASRFLMDKLNGMGEETDVIEGGVELISGVTHPQQMLAQVSACQLLIGMRLHSLIYAASQLVPLIGISYDPKIDHFLHRLHMNAAATTANFNVAKVTEEAVRLLERRDEWQKDKKAVVDALKQQAQEPARAIVTYLLNRSQSS